jgi:chemotaxis protein MotB
VPTSQFFMVAGKADTQPLFPDDPYIAANRRVTITLMNEEPPMPVSAKP